MSARQPANQPRPGPTLRPPRTRRQSIALHAQRRALGLDDATWRARLAQWPRETPARADESPADAAPGTPCRSSRDLSRRQARQLITELGLAGAPVARPYSGTRDAAERAEADGGTALATPAQRALIARLREEVRWRVSYDAWASSSRSPTRGRPVVTFRDAEAVIEALHRMRDSQPEDASHARR